MIIIVILTALVFVAASGVMSQWSIEEMTQIMRHQFNQEQMVIARNIKHFIEREFAFINREMRILAHELETDGNREKALQSSLARMVECGISKIQFYDQDRGMVYSGYPFHKEITQSPFEGSLPLEKGRPQPDQATASQVQITPSGIFITLTTPVGMTDSQLIIFHINISWFLEPYLKEIRSGQTGYAWILDNTGHFLFHPDTSFIGKDAFLARSEKYHHISFVQINQIQQDEMMAGHEGTGQYTAGWHRGVVGKMEKLIAYTPVTISHLPDQKWSIAVVAPVAEIEQAVRNKYMDQFFLQLALIFAIITGASIIMFFEVKWSRHMEKQVIRQTDELVKSEAKYRSLVESAEDFIFTVDLQGKFQSMNSFTSNFFGSRPEDHLGKELSSLFPKEMSNNLEPLIPRVFQDAKSIRIESRIDHDEAQILLDIHMVPVRSEKKEVTAVLCIARDVTEDKKLKRHLIHTEKLASLGTLAAGIAHEINNPLGVILGFCDLILRKKEKTSQEYKDLKIIERQGNHCKEIVENLLGFVRTGEDKDHQHTDLNLCLEAAIKMARHRFEKEQITLEMEFSPTIPQVKGDSRMLQQVFLNLINNAADAMPQGGKLTIRTFMDTHLHMVVAQFQDQGIAIEDKHMDHIFEPFFTTKPEGRGTGLGLFVSYGIITRVGGIMECQSKKQSSPDAPAGGTIFTVKLMVIS